MRLRLRFYKSIDDADLISDFYREHPSDHVAFDPEHGPKEHYIYVGLIVNSELVAMTSYEHLTINLVQMWSTLVAEQYRGLGLGKSFNTFMEDHFKEQGYKKVCTQIYTDNLPSIILKLKRGYIIEGTLKDHEEPGKHEYVMGKIL